ncbi:hypothetical protein DYB28_000659, partial [Aphanomyces astaci]
HLLDTLGLDLDDFDNLVQVAAERGHLQAIVRLHEMAYESGTNDALVAAATNGHLNVVEYLADSHRTNAQQVAHAVVAAAARGNMAIVQFLTKNGSSSSSARAAFTMASANGHLPIVRWLYEHGTQDWSADAFTLAAAGGHVEVLTYLTQEKPRRGATMPAMDAAAMNGHLNVVQFLHQCRPADGCSAKALEGARLNGHTDVVAYLKLHGDHLIHETCNAKAHSDGVASRDLSPLNDIKDDGTPSKMPRHVGLVSETSRARGDMPSTSEKAVEVSVNTPDEPVDSNRKDNAHDVKVAAKCSCSMHRIVDASGSLEAGVDAATISATSVAAAPFQDFLQTILDEQKQKDLDVTMTNESSATTVIPGLSFAEKMAKLSTVVQVGPLDILPIQVESYDKATSMDPDDFPPLSPRHLSVQDDSISHEPEPANSPVQATSAGTSPRKSTSDLSAPPPVRLTKEEREQLLLSADLDAFLGKSGRVMERALIQASSFDVMKDYSVDGADADDDGGAAASSHALKLAHVYRDAKWTKGRAVTDIDVSPFYHVLVGFVS